MGGFSRRRLLACSGAVLTGWGAFGAARAFAQPAIPKTELRLFQESQDTHALFQRDMVLSGGTHCRLFVASPRNAPPPSGFPILYMLDGNAVFDLLTPELLLAARDMILVGIGYDTDLRFEVTARAWDYTPPGAKDPRAHQGRRMGGADFFLNEMAAEIFPAIEKDLPANRSRRFLWGHSYGGVCALYAFLTRPEMFFGAAAISPPLLVWREGWDELAAKPQPSRDRRPLLMAWGDSERRSDQSQPTPGKSGGEIQAMAARLSEKEGVALETRIFEGAGHGDSLVESLPLFLSWAKKRA